MCSMFRSPQYALHRRAAVILGIMGFSLQSIRGLYTSTQALRDMEHLDGIRFNFTSLQGQLSGLALLTQANEQTVEDVKERGIAQAISACEGVVTSPKSSFAYARSVYITASAIKFNT